MLEDLKRRVLEANLVLPASGLVHLTFGNASGIDRARGIMAIKPSGVAYGEMREEDIVLVDLEGAVVEGTLRPSSDAPTHIALYRAFDEIGGVVHAHSEAATAFAQACREIPCLGTTHADVFPGPVPVTRFLTDAEVATGYEANTGKVIFERIAGMKPLEMPAVLVAGHGPFTWGRTPTQAAETAAVLEIVARMALATLTLDPQAKPLPPYILRKHFERKHGPQAYYGQPKKD